MNRTQLIEAISTHNATMLEMYYLEYFNDHLTVEKQAEYYNLDYDTAIALIEMGRYINHSHN